MNRNEMTDDERARIEAWQRISPRSNLHSTSCASDCVDPSHYPPGHPGMNGHEYSESCWCCPFVERYTSGNFIVHRDEN